MLQDTIFTAANTDLIKGVIDIGRECPFNRFVFSIARDHACQDLDQGRAGLSGDHPALQTAFHAQVADQHGQDLVRAEINPALIHNPKAVTIGIHPQAQVSPYFCHFFFEGIDERFLRVGVIQPG